MRTPQSLRVVGTEDPPPAPRLLQTPGPVMRVEVARVPPDPSMVEFDLTEREFPELSDDSFEAIEALDDDLEELDDLEALDDLEELDTPPPSAQVVALPTPPVDPWASDVPARNVPRTAPPPAPVAPPVAASDAAAVPPSSILDFPLPPSPVVLLARMGVAFVAALLVTMVLILLPWFVLVAPQIDAARQARRSAPVVAAVAPVAPAAPVPTPPAPAVVATPTPPQPALGPDVPPAVDPATEAEPSTPVEPSAPERVATERPAPASREPARRPAPRAAPAPRRPARPRPAPEPVAPAAVEPVVITPKPVAPVPAPVVPKVQAPARARALAGRVAGSAGSEDVSMTIRMLAEGRIAATVVRGGVRRSASGTYTLDGNDATFVLVEAKGAGTYSGKLTASGASGRFTSPDGGRERFKARR